MLVKSDAYHKAKEACKQMMPKLEMQEQAAQLRKERKQAELYRKVMSGKRLTPSERAYLESSCPELYATMRRIEAEQRAYKQALKACKTKEQVQDRRAAKMLTLLGGIKEGGAGTDSGEKLAIANAIDRTHEEFLKSGDYRKLPREKDLLEKNRRRGSFAAKA